MAIQILPSQRNAGGDLANSIGSAINQLAQNKLGELTQRQQQAQQVQALAPILGYDTANLLSNLGPDERKYALQNIGALMQLNQRPDQQQMGGMGASLEGMQQQPQQQQQQQQQFDPQQLQQAIGNRFTTQNVGQMAQEDPNSLLAGLLGSQQQQPMMQQQEAQQQMQQAPQQREQQKQQMTPDRAKLIEDIFKTPQQKRDEQKLDIEKRKEARAERTAEMKEKQFNIAATKAYVDELKNKEKAAKESDLRLKRMKKLIDKGNLPNANLWTTLTQLEEAPVLGAGAGATIGTLLLPGVGTAVGGLVGGLTSPLAGAAKSWIKTGSPDIEEFEKLTADFVKNAKQYFGPRLTDADLKIFMQTLPSLMQTDKGKKKVIENLTALNELAEIEAKAARSIIAANRGIPPLDIEQQVQDKISKKIDKVAKRFLDI